VIVVPTELLIVARDEFFGFTFFIELYMWSSNGDVGG
jgi:hypothetical protein